MRYGNRIRITQRLRAARLTEAEQAEVDRFAKLATKSRNDGCYLDAWAYDQCATDIIEKAAGIRRCSGCNRVLA